MVSPPQASGTSPRSDSCCSTWAESASGRSILLTATMIGTSAALGVVDGFDGLRHDAVVGGHDENHDVGGLGAAGAHGGEGGVARGVDEGDRLVVPHDLVGPDVLGDATGLAGHDVGRADAVEQQRLAVVDVAHHGHHGRPRALVGVVVFFLFLEVPSQQLGLLLLAGVDQADLGPDFGGEELDHVVAQATGWP